MHNSAVFMAEIGRNGGWRLVQAPGSPRVRRGCDVLLSSLALAFANLVLGMQAQSEDTNGIRQSAEGSV